MKSDLLLSELYRVQREYKEKLLKAKELFFSQNTNVILIELASFWRENKKIVECALNYLAKPYDKFFFTAATILDIEDKEHLPFLAVGRLHVWDDPIFDYAISMINTPNEKFNEKIKKQILETIDDNIKIIETTNNMIFILPIRLLFGDKEEGFSIAENLFLTLFKEVLANVDEYFIKFKTIDDIADGLREEIKEYICFDTGDESSDLREKFARYIANNELPIKEDSDEAYVFFFVIMGYLMQALDILSLSQGFQIYPYVRFKVALKYMTILALSLDEQLELRNIVNTMWACYILHNIMPTESVNDDLETYAEKLCSVNFSQRFFDSIRELENKGAFSPKKIEERISALISEIS